MHYTTLVCVSPCTCLNQFRLGFSLVATKPPSGCIDHESPSLLHATSVVLNFNDPVSSELFTRTFDPSSCSICRLHRSFNSSRDVAVRLNDDYWGSNSCKGGMPTPFDKILQHDFLVQKNIQQVLSSLVRTYYVSSYLRVKWLVIMILGVWSVWMSRR